MQYTYATATDVGKRKKINQDALLVETAESDKGNILFAAVCDGMGGLASGEKASETVTDALEDWFEQKLPDILSKETDEETLFGYIQNSLSNTINTADKDINSIGTEIGADCGTTVSCLLIIENQWTVMNIGDSRIYHFDGDVYEQVTKDHSYVQREIDKGLMTESEAEKSSMRNVLLQCVGAGDILAPDWFSGTANPGDWFLLCTDGFRHKLTKSDMQQRLSPYVRSENAMKDELVKCIEDIKTAGERDNITAVCIMLKN